MIVKIVPVLNESSGHRRYVEEGRCSFTYSQLRQQKTEVRCQFHTHQLNPLRETVRFLMDRKWSGPAAGQCLNRDITGHVCTINEGKSNSYKIYCDVLASNASAISGFWIYCSDLLVIYQAEFTITYYSLNFTVNTLRKFFTD
jgi:hypothetical protein